MGPDPVLRPGDLHPRDRAGSLSENVRRIREAYAAWSRGDIERALVHAHPEIEWRNSGALPDVAEVYHGHEGVRQFWDDWRSAWKDLTLEVERVVERGDRVLVLARFRGTGRDGIRLDRPTANVFEFANGLIVRHQSHMADPGGALAEFESGD